MKRLTNNPVTVTCLLLCLCAAALVALVTAHAEPPVNPIQACYNDTNGGLRRVNSAADCKTHETPISWNIAGPAGPQGPAGAQAHAHRREHLWSIQQLQFHGSAIDKWQRHCVDFCYRHRRHQWRSIKYQPQFKFEFNLYR